ncbi:1-deoxy-D-xylulose-5-phosphate reductoisomerase [Litoribrevibacter albus]|uniref:1-deoxy-D-xylulose 5-phosphate reductoisomerase n=1 Tax=Litoribrevibacter albus TaxID=1473156 RepID=A0AA37SB14_9GAMM|nr:1-deoxy-D-xylulose-5-phosphate reductoisomerase [Litoribrevibacter albus]GLQ31173.1 1-deoxy-D-xylulose 5-phosphate reductoisomerase [Litoribrevibacter albus]
MQSSVQQVSVLGATGSIGLNTLDVVRRHPDKYQVFALSGHSQVEQLAQLSHEFQPKFVVISDEQHAARLKSLLSGQQTEVLSGASALELIASHDDVDIVMAAIVGAAGLLPNLAAAKAGKKVLLANKESLVMSGQLFMETVANSGATLLPIDSEHNAIYQCLPNGQMSPDLGVDKILLTASGGPFRMFSFDQLKTVTPAQAVAHPNWSMGHKISVDSASLMNKGLEFIEACWLFNCSAEQVDVVVHPESVIHSMVSYVDGSVLAQLGNPDMRTPIAYGMAWPDRLESGVKPLDLFEVAQLNFEKPDTERFPCLKLAKQSFMEGGCAPAVLNAANEVAVDAFLNDRISFLSIADVVEGTLNDIENQKAECLETILSADLRARAKASELLQSITGK